MSMTLVAQLPILAGTAGGAGLGAADVLGRYLPTAAERAALAETTAGQSSRARAVVAGRSPEGGQGDVGPVVAVDMVVRGREALQSVTMVMLAASQMVMATSRVLAALALTAAADAAVAAMMLVRHAGAKRFLAARSQVAVPAHTAWWMQPASLRYGERLAEIGALLGWVHWHDIPRLRSHLGDIPPAEHEAVPYALAGDDRTEVGVPTLEPCRRPRSVHLCMSVAFVTDDERSSEGGTCPTTAIRLLTTPARADAPARPDVVPLLPVRPR